MEKYCIECHDTELSQFKVVEDEVNYNIYIKRGK